MLDTTERILKGRIHCPVCGKDAPSVGLCPECGCYTDCRTKTHAASPAKHEGYRMDEADMLMFQDLKAAGYYDDSPIEGQE